MNNSYRAVNKDISNIIKKRKSRKKNSFEYSGVSIITCTNQKNFFQNIIDNYDRQDIKNKELIIIINSDRINQSEWEEKIKSYKDIRIYKKDEKTSLGKCLNFGVSVAKYDYIAKFDDDDYYGPKYLSDTTKAFIMTGAGLVGKGATFVYFRKNSLLAIRTPNQEKRFVRFVNGSTFVFKKKIFNRVKFSDISIAEDVQFCHDCISKGIKIYSTNKYHHVYIRYPSKDSHTWKISDEDFINRYCKVIGKVENYKFYSDI